MLHPSLLQDVVRFDGRFFVEHAWPQLAAALPDARTRGRIWLGLDAAGTGELFDLTRGEHRSISESETPTGPGAHAPTLWLRMQTEAFEKILAGRAKPESVVHQLGLEWEGEAETLRHCVGAWRAALDHMTRPAPTAPFEAEDETPEAPVERASSGALLKTAPRQPAPGAADRVVRRQQRAAVPKERAADAPTLAMERFVGLLEWLVGRFAQLPQSVQHESGRWRLQTGTWSVCQPGGEWAAVGHVSAAGT